ncbi:MAG: cytochrome c biogenesis protein ResB [Elusimicrobia bacterium]|nr:cytochrome c biogenesis protein ResB [Elusimicrobiota bacterium]
MKNTLNLLRSVRFNVALIAVLAALFALGTLIPQEGKVPHEVEQFIASHERLGPLLLKMGLFHLYHTPLIMGLLGLLGFNIWICRVWPQLKDLIFEISNWRSRGKFNFPRAKWGSLVNHIGLVIVLSGSLIKGIWGFEEFLMILPGQDRAMARFPASTVSLFDFTVDFYPGTTTPRVFASDIQVAAGGRVKRQTLRVNEPLSLHHLMPLAPVRLYQASWGATGMFNSAELELSTATRIALRMNAPERIPETPFSVTGRSMMPDFAVMGNRADTKSLDWKEPALSVVFDHQGVASNPIWLLLKRPGVAFEELPDGSLRSAPPPPFRLASIDPVLFSGIQIAYDPGFPVVMLGVLFIMAGFGLYLSAKFNTL